MNCNTFDWTDPCACLARCRRERPDALILLEIFSGSGNLSQAWRRLSSRCVAFELDVRHGQHFDFGAARLQKTVRGWVQSKLVDAVWVAPPCSTFTRVRDFLPGPPAVRSEVHVYGLPGLAGIWLERE